VLDAFAKRYIVSEVLTVLFVDVERTPLKPKLTGCGHVPLRTVVVSLYNLPAVVGIK
jgi:hypothetical protein